MDCSTALSPTPPLNEEVDVDDDCLAEVLVVRATVGMADMVSDTEDEGRSGAMEIPPSRELKETSGAATLDEAPADALEDSVLATVEVVETPSAPLVLADPNELVLEAVMDEELVVISVMAIR